jgi:hypothetical protein
MLIIVYRHPILKIKKRLKWFDTFCTFSSFFPYAGFYLIVVKFQADTISCPSPSHRPHHCNIIHCYHCLQIRHLHASRPPSLSLLPLLRWHREGVTLERENRQERVDGMIRHC